MNCREFEEIVVEIARGADDAAALAHAADCRQCAARLENERQVTSTLRAYAGHSWDAGAPPRVEGALVAAFRQTNAARRPAVRWRAWASALAAGVAVFAIALGLLQPRNPVPAVAAEEQVEVATDYFPLQYGTDLTALEGAPVIRMEFPRTVLASFGLPMNPQRAAEPVQADVVLGRDGIARAIRFVQ